jgi:hypothetical protein
VATAVPVCKLRGVSNVNHTCLYRWLEKRERAMKIRYHFNTLALLVLLDSATETLADCGVCRSVVRW